MTLLAICFSILDITAMGISRLLKDPATMK